MMWMLGFAALVVIVPVADVITERPRGALGGDARRTALSIRPGTATSLWPSRNRARRPRPRRS